MENVRHGFLFSTLVTPTGHKCLDRSDTSLSPKLG